MSGSPLQFLVGVLRYGLVDDPSLVNSNHFYPPSVRRAQERLRFYAEHFNLHYPFRGLLSVHSRYGLPAHQVAIATLLTEGFSGFVTSTTASIATGRNEPVPGRDFHTPSTSAFSRRTFGLG